MDSPQKAPKYIFIWLTVFSPLLCLAVCEWIRTLPFRNGAAFNGYAPLDSHTYYMIKFGAIILSIVNAGMVISLRSSIYSGTMSGPMSKMLLPVVESKIPINTAILSVLLFLTAISNAIATYGFTLFLLNGVRADSYPFMLASFAIMLSLMPTKGLLDRMRALRRN
jgi:hypothetical protein